MVCGKIVHDSYICENEARVMENIIVEKVWLTDTEVWIRITDGREACERFADYQRLKFQLQNNVKIFKWVILVFAGKN